MTTHTAGYSRKFRSDRKLLTSITSPQEVLSYALVYRRVTCWDPCFFTICCLGLNHVFELHQLRYHMYADDTQLYVEIPRDQPAHATTVTDRISRCTADVKSWMVSHNLLHNECKTEAVVVSAAQNRKCVQPPVDPVIDVCGCSVTPKPFTRDIEFVFYDTMSIEAQTRRVCLMAYCHIRGIATIRKCLSTTAAKRPFML